MSPLWFDSDAFFFTVAGSVDFTVGSSLLTISVAHEVKPNTLTTNKTDKKTLKLLIFAISFRPIIGLCSIRLKNQLKYSPQEKLFGSVKCLREKKVMIFGE